MQLGPLRAERHDRHCMFVQAALGTAAAQAAVASGVKCVAAALRKLWKLRWDNLFKEPIGGWCWMACRLHSACIRMVVHACVVVYVLVVCITFGIALLQSQ
jgi:hypothetical protein